MYQSNKKVVYTFFHLTSKDLLFVTAYEIPDSDGTIIGAGSQLLVSRTKTVQHENRIFFLRLPLFSHRAEAATLHAHTHNKYIGRIYSLREKSIEGFKKN